MDILPQVSQFVSRHSLLTPGERVVVAVSAGADSTALADILCRMSVADFPLTLAFAYLDHGLRSQAKDEAAYVSHMAETRGLRFFWDKIDLHGEKESALEERGRRLRYQFFARCANEFQADKVAVAHHADDQAETLLMHLLRGSGIHGLAAMPPMRALTPHSRSQLIRPLLSVRKTDIIAYLKERGIAWFEDASNDDIRFTRNRVRHRVLPLLQNENFPGVVTALAHTAVHCREVVVYLEEQAQTAYSDAMCAWAARPDFCRFVHMAAGRAIACAMHNTAWDRLPHALVPFVLRCFLRAIGSEEVPMEESHYAMLEELREHGKGAIRLSGDTVIWRDQHRTCCAHSDAMPFALPQQLPVPGEIAISPYVSITAELQEVKVNGEEWLRERSPSLLEAYLREASVAPPFTVRMWQAGDTVWPLGAPGKRKIANVLSDAKIPPLLRKYVMVVTDNRGDIVWLPGITVAHCCRILAATPTVIVLRCEKTAPFADSSRQERQI
jgi:tRNA(Ile)-lysidine synthase